MSPSRSRKPVARARPRSEIAAAVAAGVGIVALTVFLVWAMRPPDPGIPGSGGLLSRQPRVTLLVVGTGIAMASAIWWVLRGRRRPRRLSRNPLIAIAVVVVFILAVLGGIFWPGGVVHHWPSQPKPEKTPTTSPIPATAPPQTQPRSTSPATKAPTITTAKPSTTPTT